ncbi:hypothetical protein DID88_008279 [Monilinia fructigena]|uniref:Uncharacterized protein n=1 Tax=Monilinia fructigena TaxID=38457 RepID=A0A395J5X6_9HELO|nr:hypothetical protein DID88_008279 [Monilinia fructigena]
MISSYFPALLAITTAITSVALAAAPQSGLGDLLLYGLLQGIDPATLLGRSIPKDPELQKRGRDQNYFRSALPGCSDDNDPSYVIGKSAYQDGEGVLSDSGMCDNKKYTGGWHCWYILTPNKIQNQKAHHTNMKIT